MSSDDKCTLQHFWVQGNPHIICGVESPKYGFRSSRMPSPDLLTLFRIALLEAATGTIVLFPGRFQPMHRGHYNAWNKLKQQFGNDVYFYTTDDTSSFKSPLTFADKRLVATRMFGVPADRILQTTSPYKAPTGMGDPSSTRLIFAISEKDMRDEPRFRFPDEGPAVRKDGEPQYLQRYPGTIDQCEPMGIHGYVLEVEVEPFEVLGVTITDATDVRELLIGPDEDAKQAFTDLYGKFDEEIYNLLRDKITASALDLAKVGGE